MVLLLVLFSDAQVHLVKKAAALQNNGPLDEKGSFMGQ